MDKFFSDSFNKYIGFIKDKVYPINNNSYKLIETNNKLIYFSSFNLEIKEFEIVYNFVKTIKENLFRKLLDATKYIVKDIISFINESINTEKKKFYIVFPFVFYIIILFFPIINALVLIFILIKI